MAYCTRAEVVERLRLSAPAAGSQLESSIDDAIVAATAQIDNATGRTFTQVDDVAKVFGPRSYEMMRVPDLISVTTLKFDDDDDGTFELTIPATDYELDQVVQRDSFPFDTLLLLNRYFPTGRRKRTVQITGSWGFAAIPAPINQACSLLASQLAQRPGAALFGVQSMGEMGGTHIGAVRPDPKLIGPYTRPAVA